MSCFKLIFAIFALSLVACDDTISINCQSFGVSLLISPASPVEFWPTDCLSHNEEQVCGVHLQPWFAPWECDDEIKIPGTDLVSDDIYELAILDCDGDELARVDFVQQELLYIQETEDFEDFENRGTGDIDWTIDETPSIVIPDPVVLITTKILASGGEFSFESGKLYRVNFNLTKNVTSVRIRVVMIDEDDSILEEGSVTFAVGDGTFDGSVDLVAPEGSVRYGFYIVKSSAPVLPDLVLNFNSHSVSRLVYSHLATFIPEDYDICNQKINLKIYNVTASPATEIYHSDGLDVAETHECSRLIEYHHNRNIAGIIYTEGSPELVLNVRASSMMRIKQFPQEDFAIELTTGVEKISGSLTAQTLFESDYAPYYWHRKLMMIFEHYYVYIDTKYWKKVDKYEIVEGDRKKDLKMGEAFLTERDFTFRLNS